MSDTTYPTPPATGTWWDPTATLDAVLHTLRLTDTDVDAARIAELIPVAGRLIDNHLDRLEAILGPPPDPVVQAELERVTIVLYRAKDSPPTSAEGLMQSAWSPTSLDALYESRVNLAPFKQRRGVA